MPWEIHKERREWLCFICVAECRICAAVWTGDFLLKGSKLNIYQMFLYTEQRAAGTETACTVRDVLVERKSLHLTPLQAVWGFHACVLALISSFVSSCHCRPPWSLFLTGPWGFANPLLAARAQQAESPGCDQSLCLWSSVCSSLIVYYFPVVFPLSRPVNPLPVVWF